MVMTDVVVQCDIWFSLYMRMMVRYPFWWVVNHTRCVDYCCCFPIRYATMHLIYT